MLLARIFLLTPQRFCQPEACFSVHRLLSLSVRGWERSKKPFRGFAKKTQLSENPACTVLQWPGTYSFKIYLVYEYVKIHNNLWWSHANHTLFKKKKEKKHLQHIKALWAPPHCNPGKQHLEFFVCPIMHFLVFFSTDKYWFSLKNQFLPDMSPFIFFSIFLPTLLLKWYNFHYYTCFWHLQNSIWGYLYRHITHIHQSSSLYPMGCLLSHSSSSLFALARGLPVPTKWVSGDRTDVNASWGKMPYCLIKSQKALVWVNTEKKSSRAHIKV